MLLVCSLSAKIKKGTKQSLIPICRGTRIRTWDPLLPKQVRYRAALRPENIPASLPKSAERPGFEPGVQLPVRQFSKLVVSATHPSLQVSFSEAAANVWRLLLDIQNLAKLF
jgi:hypothetical protein